MEKISNGGLSDNTGFLTGSQLSSPGSLLNIATSILQAYGGSLWVSSPYYSYVMSDGTGDITDNSDVGYVRDLCATYGAELVPAGWIGINSSFTNQGLSVVKTANVDDDTISLSLSGTAAAAFSDPINNLLSSNVPTNGGEIFELAAVGSDSVTPAGAATKLLLVEMNTSLSYLRGTLVPLGSKSVVALGTDCKFIRLAVYVGNWTVGAVVSANITLQKPSLRQIIGRPLFQATTGFKPKLKRVPKRLGPELVTNGDFSAGTAGWSVSGSTIAAVVGELEVTNTATSNAQAFQPIPTTAGKIYSVSGTYRRGTAENNAQLLVNNNGSFPSAGVNTTTSNQSYTTTLTAASNQIVVIALIGATTTGKTAYFDNISVREVLEWGWAWVFDGTDDLLATVSQPAATEETLVVCKDSVREASGVGTYMSKRGGGFTGAWMYTDTNSDNGLAAGNGTAWQYNGFTPPGNPTKLVMSAVTSATQVKKRTNALNTVNSFSYASGAGPVSVGGYTGVFANATVFAAAYAPVAIPDAELLIIERAMAQLAGVTTQ